MSVEKIQATTSYVARGCDEVATYTCGAVCIREAPVPPRGPSPTVDGDGVRGKVARRYDEARKLQVVRADIEVEPGVSLTFLGAPEAKLTDVLVQLRAAPYRFSDLKCEKLEILVNGVPSDGTELSSANESGRLVEQAHFDFEQFKPLSKTFPSFGTRFCSWKLELPEAAVVQVRKFLVIFSEVALEVQRGHEPTAKPAIEDRAL